MKKNILPIIIVFLGLALLIAAISWAKARYWQVNEPLQISQSPQLAGPQKSLKTTPAETREAQKKIPAPGEKTGEGRPALAGTAPVRKEERAENQRGILQGIEFLTGFSWGNLHAQDNYNLYPFIVAFDFDLKPLLRKFSFDPKPLVQFQIEPFVSFVSSPCTNAEIGTSLFLKMGLLPETSKFQPYLKAGLGMLYMTQHTREQTTQFNFIEQGIIGMHYFFRKNTAFTLETCIRHLSNAGIDHPNHGINTYDVLAGISYTY